MTNNEKLKLICTAIVEYKRTTSGATNKKCIEKYYNKSIECNECLADILIDFPLISLHDALNKEGFLIKYKSLSKIIVALKKQKNKTDIKPENQNHPQAKAQPINKEEIKKPEERKNTNTRTRKSIREIRRQSEREQEELMRNKLPYELQKILDDENRKEELKLKEEKEKNENSSYQFQR